MESDSILGEESLEATPKASPKASLRELALIAQAAYQPVELRPNFEGGLNYQQDLSTAQTAVYSSLNEPIIASRGTVSDPTQAAFYEDVFASDVDIVFGRDVTGGVAGRLGSVQRQIKATMGRFEGKAPIFVGHSLGGYLAKQLAAEYVANGARAVTFNAGQGLPSKLDVDCLDNSCTYIENYHIFGDPISVLQRLYGAGVNSTTSSAGYDRHGIDNFL
jgi:hypothetical protein